MCRLPGMTVLQWEPLSANDKFSRPRPPRFEAFMMTGDLILNLSRQQQTPGLLPKHQKKVDSLRFMWGPRHGRPSCVPVQGSYPGYVRTSRSEDHLQFQKDASLSTVDIDIDDDVTSSLNTLLDTRPDSGGNVISFNTQPYNGGNVTSSTNTQPYNGGNVTSSTNTQPYNGGNVTSSTNTQPYNGGNVTSSTNTQPYNGGNVTSSTNTQPYNGGNVTSSTNTQPYNGGNVTSSTNTQPYNGGNVTSSTNTQPYNGGNVTSSTNTQPYNGGNVTSSTNTQPYNGGSNTNHEKDRIVWTYNAPVSSPSPSCTSSSEDTSPQRSLSPQSPTSVSSSVMSSNSSSRKGPILAGGDALVSLQPNGELSQSEAISNISSPDYQEEETLDILSARDLMEVSDPSDSDSTLLVSDRTPAAPTNNPTSTQRHTPTGNGGNIVSTHQENVEHRIVIQIRAWYLVHDNCPPGPVPNDSMFKSAWPRKRAE
uniref:Uncharacterized protein n=1 Tax=Timema cristinae TaxID=61476 RepID=A0A7R9HBS6_TIMCR|nr:unnamed protein product [Timema cristinae]